MVEHKTIKKYKFDVDWPMCTSCVALNLRDNASLV